MFYAYLHYASLTHTSFGALVHLESDRTLAHRSALRVFAHLAVRANMRVAAIVGFSSLMLEIYNEIK